MTSYPSNSPMIHRAALKIAGRNKPVFPCRADKAPYTSHGFKDATTNPGKVSAFWNRFPDAMIGVPTGARSGILVLDVDRLEALGELPQELPETLTIRTPRDGLHYCFNHVSGLTNSPGSLPKGIDVRAEGGYVIVPPSPDYRVEHRAPVANAPEWLLELLREKPKANVTVISGDRPTVDLEDTGSTPDGGRNNTLTAIGGKLRAQGFEHTEIEVELLRINAARCTPPLEEDEVRKIAASVARYPAGKAGLDTETLATLDKIERGLLQREWKGKGGKSERSIVVALIKLARQHGSLIPTGIRVSASIRALALAAACSRGGVESALKRLRASLIIRADDNTRSGTLAGAFVLLMPENTRAKVGHSTTGDSLGSTESASVIDSRAPLTAPRLRWSSPAWKPKRGVVRGTRRVRTGPLPKPHPAVQRLGKTAEAIIDIVEAAGMTMTDEDLAAVLHMRRTRDLKRKDGPLSRLIAAGVAEYAGGVVSLVANWLEVLDWVRVDTGEIDVSRRDMKKFEEDRRKFRDRRERAQRGEKPERAPTEGEMRKHQESYPERRREAIERALARLFAEKPEYRGRRAGQIACAIIMRYSGLDLPRGPDGAPKDAEVEEILAGEAVA